MAPTTRAGARRALFLDESMADEPSDACSHTNEDITRARRKRRRSLDLFSYAYEEDSTRTRRKAIFTTMFSLFLIFFICMFIYEEEEEEDDHVSTNEKESEDDDDMSAEDEGEEEDDDFCPDADLLESALDCFKAMKGWIDCELGPENGVCEEVLDFLEEDTYIDQDEFSSAHKISASKDAKLRSLMALPIDMRREWLLIHIRKL